MHPDDAPVMTRVAGAPPGAGLDEARFILAAIDLALEEHAAWLRLWHRAVICRIVDGGDALAEEASSFGNFSKWYTSEQDRELVSQQIFVELWDAFRAMRENGRALLPKAIAAGCLETAAYDAFVQDIGDFERLARRVRRAFQEAVVDLDPLTGARSRRNMMDELEREHARAQRMGTTFGLALCDVDHFKAVNDTHGHLAGDAVLLSVVSRIVSNLRPYDSIFRYGGEEFLIALPDSTLGTAVGIAERLCQTIRAAPILIEGGPAIDATASLGVCVVGRELPLSDAMERADRALYAAKEGGRNRVVAWDPSLDDEAKR